MGLTPLGGPGGDAASRRRRWRLLAALVATAALGAPVYRARAGVSDELTGRRKRADAAEAARMLEACPPIAFIKRRSYGMRGTNAVMFSQATDVGSEICVYDPRRPERGARVIFHTEEGFIFNMNPSYDGRKLVFTYKTARNRPFHIWEIGVDGGGLRQLTDGPYHDFSPVYYPDGRIVFCSSRVESYSMCQNYLACALYIMNGDGSDLRRIDFTTLCTLTPAVLPDGSILCTRWEYQDKNIFGWEGLWTIRPDGRQLRLYHGNTFRIPNAVYGARPIPGTNRVLAVWAAHHHPPVGDLAVIDNTLGLEAWESMWKATHVTPVEKDQAAGPDWRKTGVGAPEADTYYRRAFADPFPFSPEYSLVSFGGDDPPRHRLYILNHNTGATRLLYECGQSCFSPVPLAPRPKPPVLAGQCPQTPGEGVFYVHDVYRGLEEQGVRRGQVKALRIMSQAPKKYNTEGFRFNDHYPVVGQGSYYVKINHGTVPVAPDGSAFFRAPSNTELYFIALDGEGKEIQRMGSVTQITTGELVSCVGCHEERRSSPPPGVAKWTRLRRPPDPISPPPWGAGPVDFVRQVQPVLDRYCAGCHHGPHPDGGVDLSGDKTRFYNMAYESLVFGGYVDYYYINQGPNGVFPALATGSWVSPLTRLLESDHGGVRVDSESRRRIYAWIDANAPYYGTWEMTRPHTIGGRDAYAHTKPGMGPRFAEQGRGRLLTEYEPWVSRFDAFAAKSDGRIKPVSRGGPNGFAERGRINLTHPEWSPVLLDNLARSAGGRAEDEHALLRSKEDPAYRELLSILREAKRALDARPRIDMPGARPIRQERNFGRTFGAD